MTVKNLVNFDGNMLGDKDVDVLIANSSLNFESYIIKYIDSEKFRNRRKHEAKQTVDQAHQNDAS